MAAHFKGKPLVVCLFCKKLFPWPKSIAKGRDKGYQRNPRYCSRRCSNLHRTAKGRYIDKYGYVILSRGKRRGYGVPEHRLVMEESLGRELRPDETVHHKNGVRHDNRVENLELWTGNHGKGQRHSDLDIWSGNIPAYQVNCWL